MPNAGSRELDWYNSAERSEKMKKDKRAYLLEAQAKKYDLENALQKIKNVPSLTETAAKKPWYQAQTALAKGQSREQFWNTMDARLQHETEARHRRRKAEARSPAAYDPFADPSITILGKGLNQSSGVIDINTTPEINNSLDTALGNIYNDMQSKKKKKPYVSPLGDMYTP